MLLAAKRPVVYSGGGVIMGNAAAPLTELAQMLNLPVTNTLMGLGGYPGRRTASSSACSGCMAASPPTWRCITAT